MMVGGAAAAVAAGLGIGVVLVGGGEKGTGVDPAELVRALDAGQALTYYARYNDFGAGGSSLEMWRRPPLFRQRFETAAAGVAGRTDVFVSGNDVTTCAEVGGMPQTCTSVPGGGAIGLDPIRAAADSLAGTDLVKSSDSVSGRNAQCFEARRSGAKGEVCVNADGIPLRVSAGELRLELVELTDAVDDAVLQPPATTAPSEAPTPVPSPPAETQPTAAPPPPAVP